MISELEESVTKAYIENNVHEFQSCWVVLQSEDADHLIAKQDQRIDGIERPVKQQKINAVSQD